MKKIKINKPTESRELVKTVMECGEAIGIRLASYDLYSEESLTKGRGVSNEKSNKD